MGKQKRRAASLGMTGGGVATRRSLPVRMKRKSTPAGLKTGATKTENQKSRRDAGVTEGNATLESTPESGSLLLQDLQKRRSKKDPAPAEWRSCTSVTPASRRLFLRLGHEAQIANRK